MSHHLMLVVANEPGVLARVALIAHRFNANIEYLRTEPLTGTELSLMEIKLDDDVSKANILASRLEGLIDVRQVMGVPAEAAEAPVSS